MRLCVETLVSERIDKLIEAAASVRLCVETLFVTKRLVQLC